MKQKPVIGLDQFAHPVFVRVYLLMENSMKIKPNTLLKTGIALGLIIMIAVLVVKRLPVNIPLSKIALSYSIKYADEATLKQRLVLPDGLKLNIYATDLGKARLMVMTTTGDILLSVPPQGKIKLISRDGNKDGRADSVKTLLSGLKRPHGLMLLGGYLYIAEYHRVVRYAFNQATSTISSKPEIIVKNIPDDGGHKTRTLRPGPDGWLYLTIGSSCNVCVEDHAWRAAMLRFKPDGSQLSVFATGLRNTVGFDWHPGTKQLYGVENSRDWLGDDFPPDELNQIRQDGFYGWPHFNGSNKPDPDFGKNNGTKTKSAIPPAHAFGAHVAPLSIRFLHHSAHPDLHNAALIALHGSWNRSKKAGYKIISLHWDSNGKITQKPFLNGFERNDDVIGRPVDVLEAPDGTLYVSDDLAGAIYRIKAKAQ